MAFEGPTTTSKACHNLDGAFNRFYLVTPSRINMMETLCQALFTTVAIVVLVYAIKILRLAFHPDLSKIPGPLIARFTTLPLKIKVLTGGRTKYIHALHQQYGPYVRIGPSEISTTSIEAYRQIHRIGTEFIKGPWYQNQSPTQYDDNTCGVFGLRNQKVAAARRRLFQQAGTKAAVLQWEPVVVGFAKLAVEKIKRDASHGEPVLSIPHIMLP